MRISDWSSDVCPSDLAEPGLERVEGEPLRAPGRLANLAHVGHVQVDQVAEGRRLGLAALQGRLAKIDPALSRGGPPAPVLAPQEGLARVRLFASDLHPPVARLEPVKEALSGGVTFDRTGGRGETRGEFRSHRGSTAPINITNRTEKQTAEPQSPNP